MNKILISFCLFFTTLSYSQNLAPTDYTISYKDLSLSSVVKAYKEGKKKSAYFTFKELYKKAVLENNLKFIYNSGPDYSLYLLESMMDGLEMQNEFYSLHNLWNNAKGPAKNLLAHTLLSMLSDYRIVDVFSYDDESMTWQGPKGDFTLSNYNLEPLRVLYEKSLLNQAYIMTKYPAKAIVIEGFLDRPTLLDLFLSKEGHRAHFETDTLFFYSPSDSLLNSSNDWVRLHGALELFHKNQNNWSAYRYLLAERLQIVGGQIASDKKFKVYEARVEEFKQNANENYFQYLIAELLNHEASNYHFKTNSVVKNYRIKALSIIDKALVKWPGSEFNSKLGKLKEEINSKNLMLEIIKTSKTSELELVRLQYRNVKKAIVEVYHLEDGELDVYNVQSLKNLKLVKEFSKTISLKDLRTHLDHQQDVILPLLPSFGTYLIVTSDNPDRISEFLQTDSLSKVEDISWQWFSKSNLHVQYSNLEGRAYLYVSRKDNGQPVSKAMVRMSDNALEKVFHSTFLTDKKGFLEIGNVKSNLIRVIHNQDSVDFRIYGSNSGPIESMSRMIYTDRAIYRPGQKVELKVISLKNSNYKSILASNDKVQLKVMDVNQQPIYETILTTTEMGSAYASFVLPSNMLTGAISFLVNNSYVGGVEVEEYKRPTYYVEWLKPDSAFRLNQPFAMKGQVRSYAGYPILDAEVSVSVYEQRFFPRGCVIGPMHQRYDTSFVVKTDNKGEFLVTYNATQPKETSGVYVTFQSQVVNQTGESQFAMTDLFIGKGGFDVSVSVPDEVIIGRNERVKFSLYNSAGVKLDPQEIFYTIQRKPTSKVFKENIEEAEFKAFQSSVFERNFPFLSYASEADTFATVFKNRTLSDRTLSLDSLKLEPGNYRIIVQGKDNLDHNIESTQTFDLISLDSRKNQHTSTLWAMSAKDSYEPGERGEIYVGTSYKKLPVFVFVKKSDGTFHRELIQVKKRKKISYLIDTNVSEGIQVYLMTVQNGNSIFKEISLEPQRKINALQWKWISVKDKTLPGVKESWSFSLMDGKGNPINGEVMLGMYDKSLDQFVIKDWNIPNTQTRVKNMNWNTNYHWPVLSKNSSYSYNNRFGSMGYGIESNKASRMDRLTANMPQELDEVESGLSPDNKAEEANPKTSPRNNFSETAFFIPQLKIENGLGSFSFVVPDAMTTFRFRALAHTKDTKFHLEGRDLIVQKEVIVETFEPRFFRSGDRLTWIMTIQNLSDRGEWFKPSLKFTDEAGTSLNQEFNIEIQDSVWVEKKNYARVDMTLDIPEMDQEVTFVLGAESKTQGDYIQKKIPVLSSEQVYQYDESFVVQGPDTLTLNWDIKNKVPASATIKDVKVHYFANDDLLLLKEMARLFYRKNDLNESYLYQYFAAALCQKLLRDNKELKPLLMDFVGRYQPLSELNKSAAERKKDLIETPWFSEAMDELGIYRSFQLLLDDEVLENYKKQALEQILSRQLPNGGWSWIGEDQFNKTVTEEFVFHLSLLKERGIDVKTEWISPSLDKLEKMRENELSRMSEADRTAKKGLTPEVLKWLLYRTTFGLNSTATSLYYSAVLRANWLNLPPEYWPLAGKYAMKIEDLFWAGVMHSALEDAKSNKPKQGEFWMFETKDNYGSLSQIEAQLFGIDFYRSLPTVMPTDKLKQWVILQKRASSWQQLRTIALAAYTIIGNSSKVANKTIISWKGSDAITLTEPSIDLEFPNLKREVINQGLLVKQVSPTTQFIDLSTKYQANVDKIVKSNGEFRIERKYYVLKNDKEILLTDKSTTSVGDQIRVKIKIICAQPMSYLHLVDPKMAGQENKVVLSGYQYQDFAYYVSPRDKYTELFIEKIPAGTHQLSYDMVITTAGVLQIPAATIESYYQPQKAANSAFYEMKVK